MTNHRLVFLGPSVPVRLDEFLRIGKCAMHELVGAGKALGAGDINRTTQSMVAAAGGVPVVRPNDLHADNVRSVKSLSGL